MTLGELHSLVSNMLILHGADAVVMVSDHYGTVGEIVSLQRDPLGYIEIKSDAAEH